MPIAVIAALALGFGVAYLLSRKDSPAQVVKETVRELGGGTSIAPPPRQATAGPITAPTPSVTVISPSAPKPINQGVAELAKTFPSLFQGLANVAVEKIRADSQEAQQRIKLRPNDLVSSKQAADTLGNQLRAGGDPLQVNVFAASDGRSYDPTVLSLQAVAQAQAQAAFDQALAGDATQEVM